MPSKTEEYLALAQRTANGLTRYARLFDDDSSYYLLCSLENLDEQGQLKSKAAMFTKRTIRPERTVTSVDTPSEALAVSIGEHGKVDLPYMAELLGTPGEYERITTELSGVIFKDPAADPTDPEAGWQMADEYLSGDVRAKLRMAQFAAETNPEFAVNVDKAQKDLISLKAEILACIKGESVLPKETLAEMITAQEEKLRELDALYESSYAETEKTAELMDSVSKLYEELISYADLYDSASFEAKKMIVSQLIRRVDVYRGYQIHVDFNFDLAQYLENSDELAC